MGENTVLDSLVDENVELVRSGVRVIGSAPAELYRDGHDRIASGGVGRHFRHVLEFYDCLLHCGDGTVDYQARRRDPRVERDAGYAAEAAGRIVTRLDALRTASGDRVLTVASEVHDRSGAPIQVRSSLARELAVLASHTIHHYAIVAILLRQGGVTIPRDFGVAPSTLRYLASREA